MSILLFRCSQYDFIPLDVTSLESPIKSTLLWLSRLQLASIPCNPRNEPYNMLRLFLVFPCLFLFRSSRNDFIPLDVTSLESPIKPTSISLLRLQLASIPYNPRNELYNTLHLFLVYTYLFLFRSSRNDFIPCFNTLFSFKVNHFVKYNTEYVGNCFAVKAVFVFRLR